MMLSSSRFATIASSDDKADTAMTATRWEKPMPLMMTRRVRRQQNRFPP